jgi:hypothetical protein
MNLLPGRDTRLVTYCNESSAIINEISGVANKNGFLFGDFSQLKIIAYNASIDGHPVLLGKILSPDAMILKSSGKKKIRISNDDLITPVSDGKPVIGKVFSVVLRIIPVFNSHDLQITDENDITSHILIIVQAKNLSQ